MNEESSIRRLVGCLVLIVVVSLAGCNAFVGSSNDASGATSLEPVTPAPVPSDSPTPIPGPDDVPGLSTEGVENASALLAAHTDSLQNTSFTLEYNSTVFFDNGTITDEGGLTARAGSGSKVFARLGPTRAVNQRNNRMSTRTELWSDGNQSFFASMYPNDTAEYTRIPPEQTTNRSVLSRTYLFSIEQLDTQNSRVSAPLEANGTVLYRIRGQVSSYGGNNQTITALVNPDGRLYEYHMTRSIADENVSRRISIRYTHVGTTTVERPSWYDDAVENATTPEPRTAQAVPTDTTSRAGTTTGTGPTSETDTLAPGLTEAGVENASALLDAHAESFRNTSFTLEYNSSVVFDNGTVGSEGTTTVRVGTGSRLFARFGSGEIEAAPKPNARPVGTELWHGEDRSFLASNYANQSSAYTRLPPERSVNRSELPGLYLSRINNLDTRNSEVRGRIRRNGTTLYRVRGRITSSFGGRNLTITAFVDSRGRIHDYRVVRHGYRTNRTRRTSVRYTHVGTTSVERPPWYDDAVENATTPGSASSNPATSAPSPSATSASATQQMSSQTDLLAPGVTISGVENATALLDAHTKSLQNTSFIAEYDSATVAGNGTVVGTANTTARVGRGSQVFVQFGPGERLMGGRSRELPTRELWSNGGLSFGASLYANGTRKYVRVPPERAANRTTLAQAYLFSITNFDTQNSRVVGSLTRDNTTLYRIEAQPYPVYGDDNRTTTALVDARGRIHEYHVLRPGFRGNTTRRSTVRYTGIGSTSVARPLWYHEAIARTTPVNATATAQRG